MDIQNNNTQCHIEIKKITCLFNDETRRVALVQQSEFASLHLCISRIEEDPAVHQGAVEVGYEGADVSVI